MPNTKGKLIKKIDPILKSLPWGQITPNTAEQIADCLIEEGVTVNGEKYKEIDKFIESRVLDGKEYPTAKLYYEDYQKELERLYKGVTVQEWISVNDGLPKLIPCGAGTAYSEAVNVLTTGRKVLTAIWDGFDWICDAEFWDAEDEEITHWIPVLLPLPQPPKGD